MLKRYRSKVKIDHDSVSPDSIRAACSYGIGALEELAARDGNVIDWNATRIFTRAQRRSGDLAVDVYGRQLKA